MVFVRDPSGAAFAEYVCLRACIYFTSAWDRCVRFIFLPPADTSFDKKKKPNKTGSVGSCAADGRRIKRRGWDGEKKKEKKKLRVQ